MIPLLDFCVEHPHVFVAVVMGWVVSVFGAGVLAALDGYRTGKRDGLIAGEAAGFVEGYQRGAANYHHSEK